MFISFVVATYNCVDLMPTLNDMVRPLSHLDREFCISGGSSIGGTSTALESTPNARIIRSSPDEGIYDAWNKVLPYCRGDFLAFIGVDDRPVEKFFLMQGGRRC